MDAPSDLELANQKAREYWRNSTTTFISSAGYYDRVELALNDVVIPAIGKLDRMLDIGCGNGRFTYVLARAATHMLATDISPNLISEAKSGNPTNIDFQVRDLAVDWPAGEFDLVSCMGVTSILVDESEYGGTLRRLHASVKPGGLLLMRDSLSASADDEVAIAKTRPSIYRAAARYLKDFRALGLRPELTIVLKTWKKKNRRNMMILFRKPSGPWQRAAWWFRPPQVRAIGE
jgi:SAM-dependent methyltransferase